MKNKHEKEKRIQKEREEGVRGKWHLYNTRRKKMNLDFTAIAALVVVLVLFFVIFKLSKKLDFTLLVIVALAAGVAIGFIFHGHTSWITPIGKAYVSVLSALVSPLIIVAIISSITSLENTKQLKGIGFRSIGWLITTTFFAIMLALGLGLELKK